MMEQNNNDVKVTPPETTVDDAKSSIAEFELPCGYLHTDKVLDIVELRELTGVEEDILASRKISNDSKLNKVLVNCINILRDKESSIVIKDKAKLSEIVPKMATGDRLFLLIRLRQVSLGDNFEFQTICPECKKKQNFIVNLNDLKVLKLPELISFLCILK